MITVLQTVCKYHWKVFALVVFLGSNLQGQSIFTNPITDANPSASNPFTAGQTVDANITVSGIGRGSGVAANAGGNRYNANSWNTVAIDLTAYFEFTLTPNTGFEIDFVSFVYTSQRSDATIANFAFRSSLDGFTSNIGSPDFDGITIDLSASTYQNITSAITFRFYAWGADTGARTFSINDFTFNGTVSAVASGASTLTAGALTETTTISSVANTSGTAVQNFDFTLTDDGATPATDATTTRISQITFNQGAGNDVADWTQAIAGAELTDGTSTLTGTITATGITFASLANTNPGDFGYIDDNANKTYTLKVWLSTALGGTLTTSIEGLNLVFEVTTSSITLEAGSSTFLAGETESSGATNNAVSVVATQYFFRTVPSNVATSNNFTVVVDATDANNNRDIDNISAVTLVKNTGTGNLTVTSPQNLVAGTRSFTDCQLDAADTYTLDASGAFATITSGNITATVAVTGDYRSRNTTGTWNTATDWERFDGTNWVTAATAPSSTDGTITILSGHTITVNTNITIDQVVIASGGTISYTSNLITLNDGTGDDLIIYGTFDHNGGTLLSISTGATVLVKTDGIMRVTSNTGSTSDGYAGNGATAFTYETGATFNWNSINAFATGGQTYFGNAGTSVIPIFRTSQNIANVGAGTNTTINGIFEANGNITWQNTGTKTFRNGIRGTGTVTQENATTGAFIINGDNTVLGGNLVLNTNGLQINHTGTTTLNSNISVSGGTITLTSGDIDLNGFNIDLGTNGSIQEDLTNNHIIKDNTATTEANPGGYVRATTRAVTNTGVNIAGLGLLLGDATGYNVNIDRYHYRAGIGQAIKRIYKITGTPTATTLRINYAEDELAGINESELGMFRWRSSTGWFNYTTGETKDATANFAEVTGITAFSHWTLGSELTPLPVRLISFKAEANKEGNSLLTWTTASEQNNTGFEIQKSENGEDFNAIGFVDGNGNSNQIRNYQFEDKEFTNSSYYRLKQIDADGKFSISNLVYIEKEASKFYVYPNPIDDKALYFNVTDESIETKLINAQGKTLWQYKGNVGDTERALHQFIKQSPQGMYLIQINTDKGILQTKIVR